MYDMQNQHWMIILIVYLSSYHTLWTSSNCVVYSLNGSISWRPGKCPSDFWEVVPPCPSEVLRYCMKVVQHHLFVLSRLNRNTMAIKLQQNLVKIWEQTMGRERTFAFDFSLFFARIAILIPNVNLSLAMCTFKLLLVYALALVYTLISRFCFCSFCLNHVSS